MPQLPNDPVSKLRALLAEARTRGNAVNATKGEIDGLVIEGLFALDLRLAALEAKQRPIDKD